MTQTGTIYKITNVKNGKIYIGQTRNTIKQRFNGHKHGCNSCSMAIAKAIKKHGKENFIIEAIEENIDLDNLEEREIYWINHFNSMDRKIGYNSRTYLKESWIISEEGREIKSKTMIKLNNTPERKLINIKAGRKPKLDKSLTTSKYMGVSYQVNKLKRKTYEAWVAKIGFEGKMIDMGRFKNEIDAAYAYDIKSIELFGKEINLNFPELLNDYIEGKIIPVAKSNGKTSKYIGVSDKGKFWIATIYLPDKSRRIKSAKTELEAARLYNELTKLYNLAKPLNQL